MQVLEKVRGTPNVDLEFEEQIEIVRAAKAVPNSFKSLLFDPRYRPQLAVVVAMPIFQQWTVWPSISLLSVSAVFLSSIVLQLNAQYPDAYRTLAANKTARLPPLRIDLAALLQGINSVIFFTPQACSLEVGHSATHSRQSNSETCLDPALSQHEQHA